jgi:Tfp pilus assembly protein FimT
MPLPLKNRTLSHDRFQTSASLRILTLKEKSHSRPGAFNAGPFRDGHTFLEICLVLFIIVLIAGAAIPLTSGIMEKQRFRDCAQEIQNLARTAKHLALVQQRTYVIHINRDRLVLEPKLLAGLPTATDSSTSSTDEPPPTASTAASLANSTSSDSSDADTQSAQPSYLQSVQMEYAIPEGVVLTIRGWLDKEWSNPEDRDWVFPPTGLCEPLGIRIEKGAAYIENIFDPVTAAVKEENYYFP